MTKLSQKEFKKQRQKNFWTCSTINDDGDKVWDETKRQETLKAMRIDLEAHFDINTCYKIAKDMKYITENYELAREQKEKRLIEKQNQLENELREFIDNQDAFTPSDLQGVITARVKKNCKIDTY